MTACRPMSAYKVGDRAIRLSTITNEPVDEGVVFEVYEGTHEPLYRLRRDDGTESMVRVPARLLRPMSGNNEEG